MGIPMNALSANVPGGHNFVWDPIMSVFVLRNSHAYPPQSRACPFYRSASVCQLHLIWVPQRSPLRAGLFYHLMQKTAYLYNVQYVIVDMSPGSSMFNQAIFMSSNGFFMPSAIESKVSTLCICRRSALYLY